jgi:hypothetical protein
VVKLGFELPDGSVGVGRVSDDQDTDALLGNLLDGGTLNLSKHLEDQLSLNF